MTFYYMRICPWLKIPCILRLCGLGIRSSWKIGNHTMISAPSRWHRSVHGSTLKSDRVTRSPGYSALKPFNLSIIKQNVIPVIWCEFSCKYTIFLIPEITARCGYRYLLFGCHLLVFIVLETNWMLLVSRTRTSRRRSHWWVMHMRFLSIMMAHHTIGLHSGGLVSRDINW